MNFVQDEELRSIVVVKFIDKLSFEMDEDNIRNALSSACKDSGVCGLKGRCTVTELGSGRQEKEEFVLAFKGLFRSSLHGRIWLPDGLYAKDYDKYSRTAPYLLTFAYRDLEVLSSEFFKRFLT